MALGATALAVAIPTVVVSVDEAKAETFSEGVFTYNVLEDGTLEVKATTSTEKNIVVPSEVNGKKVTKIGINVFAFKKELNSVEIPEGVTEIGNKAFYSTTALTSVKLPSTLEKIGENTFYNTTSMKEITLPENLKVIGVSAFNTSGLETVKFGNKLETIGEQAFYLSKLTTLELPNSVKTIGKEAFRGNKLTSLVIPEGVTHIGDSAFNTNLLTSVTLPSTLETIGVTAFGVNKLPYVVIPEKVKTIGTGAFKGNQAIESIFVVSGVAGSAAEQYANTAGHTFSTNMENPEVPTFGEYQATGYKLGYTHTASEGLNIISFTNQSLTGAYTIDIPETIDGKKVTGADINAFELYSNQKHYDTTGKYPTTYLAKVFLPNIDFKLKGKPVYTRNHTPIKYTTTLDIGLNLDYYYSYDNGTYVSMNDMAVGMDYNDSPQRVDTLTVPEKVFGNDVKRVDKFRGLTINTLVLPTTLEEFGSSAFSRDTTVRKLDLSKLVNLKKFRDASVTFASGSELILGQSSFSASKSIDYTVKTPVFTGVISTLRLADDVKNVSSPLFMGAYSNVYLSSTVENIIFNEGLETIGSNAFRYTKGLQKLELPKSLKTIESYAFADISSILEVTIPANVVSVGTDAFGGTNSLGKVTVYNKFLKYPTGNKPFRLSQSGQIHAYEGSTTHTVYALDGFLPLSEQTKPGNPLVTPDDVWSFANPDKPFVGVVPTMSVIGGKELTSGITISQAKWVTEEQVFTTTHGDIVLTPDGNGNTIVTIPNGLNRVTEETKLDVEHQGVNFLDIIIKPQPKISFSFGL